MVPDFLEDAVNQPSCTGVRRVTAVNLALALRHSPHLAKAIVEWLCSRGEG